MKQFLITLLVIIAGGISDVSAQPFSEGCKWSYCIKTIYIHEDRREELTFYRLEFAGTRDINGKTYRELYVTGTDNAGSKELPIYVLGLREENGRIYASYDEFVKLLKNSGLNYEQYPVTEDNEVVLYDFTLEPGDYFGSKFEFTQKYVKEKTRKIMADGKERDVLEIWQRYYWFEEEYGEDDVEYDGDVFDDYKWDDVICGIGATEDLIAWLSPYDMPLSCPYFIHLNVYLENDKLVYKADDYYDDPFFGDIVSGINGIRTDVKDVEDDAYYDLSGRRIEGTPRSGLYIKGGRKVVVR